jgi:hypothetical protein
MTHTRGRPYHPMTQAKIERWHRSMKNQVLLEHYYLPGDLERRIGVCVEYYNHERYHESLDNLIPADVFYGRGQKILTMYKARSPSAESSLLSSKDHLDWSSCTIGSQGQAYINY